MTSPVTPVSQLSTAVTLGSAMSRCRIAAYWSEGSYTVRGQGDRCLEQKEAHRIDVLTQVVTKR